MRKFDSYELGEARTAGGQLLHFACRSGKVEEVAALLSEVVKDIDIPSTRHVSVGHGGYGMYSRYDVKQHRYAGGGPGEGGGWVYTEVLEVKNPPNGRQGFVIHEESSDHGEFSEWKPCRMRWRPGMQKVYRPGKRGDRKDPASSGGCGVVV